MALKIIINTIPHKKQRYNTVGDFGGTTRRWVTVSEMNNPSYELAVAIHELIEQHLTGLDGISVKEIDKFDKLFEEEFKAGLHANSEEPGDDPRAPYFWHHQMAGIIERLFIQSCGLTWKDYEETVTRVWRAGDNIAGLKPKKRHD
jgi:hypothetical protein